MYQIKPKDLVEAKQLIEANNTIYADLGDKLEVMEVLGNGLFTVRNTHENVGLFEVSLGEVQLFRATF